MLEENEWLIYNGRSLQQPLPVETAAVDVDNGICRMNMHHDDASNQVLLATESSGPQLPLTHHLHNHTALRPPFPNNGILTHSSASNSSHNLTAASPHMAQLMNIANFSTLLDSSSSSSTNLTAPVIQMNDSNNEDFLGRQQQQAAPLLISMPPLLMAAGEHTSIERPHADQYANTPAMLQLLTALNGSSDNPQLNHLPAHGEHYGPPSVATLNFFQGTEVAHSTLSSHRHATLVTGNASLEALDHNSVQQGHVIAGVHEKLGASSSAHHEFLNLFSKELECFSVPNTTAAPSYLLLQPLEIHPSTGSPPTLFQKRAAQRRLLAPIVPSQASSAITASEVNSAAVTTRAKMAGTPSPFTTTDQLVGAEQQAGSSLEAVNDGEDNFLAEDEGNDPYHAACEFSGPDQYELRGDNQRDETCEALFHLQDPVELQMMDPVHGSALQEMIDDDELLLGCATGDALQLATSASQQQLHADDKVGRGKVKGPPAKNLMAERRRRKKLNDRLYTLRSVVPKISKMDRASILGDAIEYLKELLQRINDLHNELEANSAAAPMPTSNTSFTNNSSCLTPTSTTANLPAAPFVKLEDCPSTTSQTLQSMAAGSDPPEPPKIEVRAREGRALNIHMFCGKRPGLLLATMRALDGLGLDVQQAVISCFNGFALDVFRAEQSQEEDVEAEEIKKVLLFTATSAAAATATTSSY